MTQFSNKALQATVGTGSGLGFGCMGITAFYGDAMPDEDAKALLKAVYDTGCRHFDTAEIYATKEKYNEDVLGDFFQTVPRDSFTVATKYWPQDGGKYDYDRVKKALQASLKRLKMDYVDLYYAHRVMSLDGGLEFAETAKRLKEEGLIKEVGLSEVSGTWLRQIHAICPISAVQQEWSLMTRSLEDDLVPVCKELGVTVVAYSPLARNMLAIKQEAPPADWRASLPRYTGENFAKNNEIAKTVHDLSEKHNCSAAELSIAWLFHKADKLGVQVVPIPGSTKIKNATSNVGSCKVSIADPDLEILERLASQVAGERYSEDHMKVVIEGQKV